MSLLYLLLLFVTLGCVTHFWMVPFANTKWQAGDLRVKVARAAALTLVEKTRELCGIGIATITTLIVAVWTLSQFHEKQIQVPEGVIDSLSLLHSIATHTAVSYRGFLIVFGALVLGILLFRLGRGAKRRVARTWMAKAEEIQKRILENPHELDTIRDDPVLGEPINHLDELIRMLGTEHLTNEQAETVQREMQKTLTYIALEMANRELDVENALRKAHDRVAPPKRTARHRLLRIMTSAQLSRELGLLNRRLSRFATAVLLVSLTGWVATPLANSLQLTVNNLRMHSVAEDVDRTLSEAISRTVPSETDAHSLESDADTVSRASRLLSRATLRQLQTSGALERSAGLAPSMRARSEFVRAAILERTPATPEPGAVASSIRAQVAMEVASGNAAEGTAHEVLEQIHRQVRPVVETIGQREPRLVNLLLTRLQARYGATASPVDVGGQLISNMVSQAFGSLRPQATNELAKQAQDLALDVGRNAIATWTSSYAKAIAAANLSDDAVLENLRAVQFEISRESLGLIRELDAAREAAWLPSAAEGAREQMWHRVADVISRRVDEAVTVGTNLGGYSSLFARAPEVVAHAGVPGRAGARIGTTLGRRASSMSFGLASRSFKARGVLFGRDLEAEGLDVSDIAWSIEEDTDEGFAALSLSLKANGGWIPVGRYRAGIVNQALRYAADQRVVAATIVPGDGSIVSRVTYLHPVLVDTPLGCRVVEADRFIDEFTAGEDGIDDRLREIARRRSEIWDFRQIARVAEYIAANCDGCSLSESDVETLAARIVGQRGLTSSGLQSELDEFVAGDLRRMGGNTAFVVKVLRCAGRGRGNVLECLADEFGDYDLPRAYWFPEDHTSQFREKDMRLDGEYRWLERSEDRFGHIVLWLHTTFALRGRNGKPVDDSTSAALDFPEQLIEVLNDVLIRDLIPEYLEAKLHSPSYSDFMAPLEDFVILQRLMRAAMNGQLGDGFALEKLINLERDTRDYVPCQPTVRWEATPDGQDELWETLREIGPEAVELHRAAVRDQLEWVSGRRRCLEASR